MANADAFIRAYATRKVMTGSDQIAVVGAACRFPGARDLDAFARLLMEGRAAFESVSPEDADRSHARGVDPRSPDWVGVCAPLADAECFDTDLFGYTRREAEIMDPQQRAAMQCAYAALEDAAIMPGSVDHSVGVYLASSPSTFLLEYLSSVALRASLGVDALALVNHADFISTAISYRLDLRGPSMGIQTGCSGSLVAVHAACEALRSGACDLALAGGVSIRMPQRTGYHAPLGGVASPSGACRPFAADSDGTVFGSGAGVVVLERLNDAIARGSRVLGVIVGSAVNNDGRSRAGFVAPSQAGQAAVVAEAITVAGLSPDDVMYVEGHGTGTRIGDDIELRALAEVFGTGRRRRPLLVGSCKGNIGHADAAAGIAGLLKLLLAFREDKIPSTLGTGTCSAGGDAVRELDVPRDSRAWPAGERRRAGVSSFGIGGTNAHVVVEEPPRARPRGTGASNLPSLITLSAATTNAVTRRARDLATWLDRTPDVCLADVAHTLNVGREPLRHRIGVVAANVQDASRALRLATPTSASPSPLLVFLVPGWDERAAVTARALRDGFPPFRAAFARVAALALCTGGPDLELVLDRPLEVLGVVPDVVMGHGVGEWGAAILAGTVERQAGIAAVCCLARAAQTRLPEPAIAVALSAAASEERLSAGLAVVAVEGRSCTIVSGPRLALDEFCVRLDELAVPWTPREGTGMLIAASLRGGVAMIPDGAAGFASGVAAIPWVSSVDGRFIEFGGRAASDHWDTLCSRPVNWVAAVERLQRHLGDKAGGGLAVDLGPTGDLAAATRRLVPDSLRTWSAPAAGNDSPVAWLQLLVGVLNGAGKPVLLHQLSANGPRGRVSLPAYPFATTAYLPPRDEVVVGPASAPTVAIRVAAWRREQRYVPTTDQRTRDRWLVLVRDVADPLVELLRQAGAEVVTAEAGHEFERRSPTHFVVRPNCFEDLASIVDPREFTHALHRWSTGDEGDDERERGVIGAIHLLRVLSSLRRRDGLHVFFVTERALDPSGIAPVVAARASMGALARVAGQEIAGLWSSHIDADLADVASSRDILLADRPHPVVALRAGHPFIPVFSPLAPGPHNRSLLAHRGVYVIVGGTGRFGTIIGRLLVDRYNASVISLARGATRLYSEADVAGFDLRRVDIDDRDAVAATFQAVHVRYGKIDGVIHAAGVISDETHRAIVELDERCLDVCFDCRVRGFSNIQDAIKGIDVPLKLLTSSMAPILGGLGLAAYGAAHAWIDAVADASPDWRAIHWEGWHRDRSGRSNYGGSAAHAQDQRMLSDDEVRSSFEAAMQADVPRRIVVTRDDLERRLAEWVPRAPFPSSDVELGVASTDVRGELIRIVQSLLGVEPADDDDLFELGANSLNAVQLLSRLRAAFGLDVPLRVLFESPSIARLLVAIEAIRQAPPAGVSGDPVVVTGVIGQNGAR